MLKASTLKGKGTIQIGCQSAHRDTIRNREPRPCTVACESCFENVGCVIMSDDVDMCELTREHELLLHESHFCISRRLNFNAADLAFVN